MLLGRIVLAGVMMIGRVLALDMLMIAWVLAMVKSHMIGIRPKILEKIFWLENYEISLKC